MRPSLKFIRVAILGLLTGIVGLCCLVITIGQFFNWNAPFLPNKNDLAPVILGAIATLLVGVGIEQSFHVVIDRQDDRLNDLELLVKGSLGGQYLITTTEIEAALERLVATIDRQIRAFSYGKGVKFSRRLAENIARRLRQQKNIGMSPEIKVVIAMDFGNVPANFQTETDKRNNLWAQYGVGNILSLYLLDTKIVAGLDVFIIDKMHLTLNIPLLHINALQRSLLFENRPVIAADFVDWFDNTVLPKAIPYETWKQQNVQVIP